LGHVIRRETGRKVDVKWMPATVLPFGLGRRIGTDFDQNTALVANANLDRKVGLIALANPSGNTPRSQQLDPSDNHPAARSPE
jgi:hypothetical protein